MSSQLMLIKAIRSGRLAEVRAALDSGTSAELTDGHGDPGLPMGIACFMGYSDIVRELASRGARVNVDDNSAPTSPLSMAIRGQRNEVVRTLIELGAQVPAGTNTGLNDHEIMLAQWKAKRDGFANEFELDPVALPDIEEIDMVRCAGTDTQALESELLRMAIKQNR